MKTQKIIALLLLFAICIICFCACNPGYRQEYFDFPNNKEYSIEEVRVAALEKYNLTRFVYDNNPEWQFLEGKVGTTSNLPFALINPDNVDVAINSFAGRDADYNYQMDNMYFACYINIAEDANGNYKFVFYNTHILRTEKIEDTIGTCDYTSDIPPEYFFTLNSLNRIVNYR